MVDFGSFISSFISNISVMLLLMYTASIGYKHAVYRLSSTWKEALFIILAIAAGWITMHYGFRFSGTVIFDLRFMAVIVAPMFVRNPLSIVMIGAGIGLGRLGFGINQASIVGASNVFLMGLLCAGIVIWAARKRLGFYRRMSIVILSVNVVNVLFIAAFGVIPAGEYLTKLAPGSLVLGLTLAFLFVAVLRDFVVEAGRKLELEHSNARLQELYSIADERARQLQSSAAVLEEKNQQIMLASRYKSEFLANMSHEVRTPLNAMLTMSQLLEENDEGRLSPDELRYASIIQSSGQELLAILNDVLDMSKIEAGRMDLFETTFSLREMLERTEIIFRPVADQKRLAFAVSQEGQLPALMTADVQRLQQILKNLLSNALKFTEKGEIRLTVRIAGAGAVPRSAQMTADTDWVAFEVRDSGIGIPADQHARVFEAFYQADGATSRQYGGTGLGLSISRQFAERMGGFIDLDSTSGEGSRFTLYLPQR